MKTTLIPQGNIEQKIFVVRGLKIMLSTHLAELYGVEPRTLIQTVKRNKDRFPEDFMFQLNNKEFIALKSQIVISSWGGLRRANPYAFTEQGVAMLSSILRSKRSIQVNITIMRTFIKLRKFFSTHKGLAHKIGQLEQKTNKHDKEIQLIFKAIHQLMTSPATKPKGRIGFHSD